MHAVCLFVCCLTSQQQASVSQGRICSDNFTCCHTEIEVADPTFYLTQSQYTDTGLTSASADPITPGAGQGSHWSANFEVTGMTQPRKNPGASGIRTRDLLLSRRTPYHLANEVVVCAGWGWGVVLSVFVYRSSATSLCYTLDLFLIHMRPTACLCSSLVFQVLKIENLQVYHQERGHQML